MSGDRHAMSMTAAPEPLTLAQLNAADAAGFIALLAGTYEHSPWIAEQAWARRPAQGFISLTQLKRALVDVVRAAPRQAQLDLIRAHPELAGKAMVSRSLTAESTGEQQAAGLTHCSPEEFARLQSLNQAYNERFGWPFILAVKGPRGRGYTRQQIIEIFARRLQGSPEFEFAECLRNIHRIAEMRLDERFEHVPTLGNLVWDWAETLSTYSEPESAALDQLTVTYLTPAHQACARWLVDEMTRVGFDAVRIDAVGNVVALWEGTQPNAPRLLLGSHYDTVRNGGKYDGRLGILAVMAAVHQLHRQGVRLPFGLELVAFSEEEGQRFASTFFGSSALTGSFDPAFLTQTDAQGISVQQAMVEAGLPGTLESIRALQRDPQAYCGFLEIHIEQGPVLDSLDLPLGVVSAINGSARYRGMVEGEACHAGTTPMGQRRDAALTAAELALALERLATAHAPAVGTMGVLDVPQGAINVVPGRCRFTLDMRAPSNAQRDALVNAVLDEARAIAARRGTGLQLDESMRASAAPSDPALQAHWEAAVQALGLPVFHLPSGAGHDAMKIAEILPQAMLFVRGGNAGISHNPLETVTNHDCELAVQALLHVLQEMAAA
jgi:beta-ureidopropionase / N-carbamoyl-L-amino-acid hydrolase